jgi:response regulator RpfG family c-di-GMP phosphodiesterase
MITIHPKILCVDDELVNLKLYDAFLQPQGFEVLHAQSGARALEIILAERVDLVLLDVMMPEMNGYDVCRLIKEDREHGNVPVVMITSLQQRQERTKGIEAGAEDFISKPIDQGEVLARIRMLLRVRELNEQLSRSYASVTGLTDFAKESLQAFDPADFELMPRIDLLVNRIIRQGSGSLDRPQVLVVGVQDRSQWKWYYYDSPFKELIRREFELDALPLLPLPGAGNSSSVFALRSELAASGLADFVSRLEEHPLLATKIHNIFSFLSAGFCVFAANYDRDVTDHDAAILNTLATQGMFFKQLADQVRQNAESAGYTVGALLRSAALHGAEDENHPLRVGEYSALLALRLGLGERFAGAIRLQAQLHDAGNSGVPLEVLNKEGAPDFKEWEIIRAHTRLGAEIIGDHPSLAMARVIALSHHENWDGSGYPHWLQGEQIPLAGRIVALADRYDALRVARPYKPAMDHPAACELICGGNERVKPEHFDPAVLAAFQELAPRFAEIFDRLREPSCKRRAG